MKKWFVGFFSLIASFFAINFVSASILPYNLASTVQDLVWTVQETFRPILEALIGGYSSSEFLFAKLLLLILLFVICKYSLENVPKLSEQPGVIKVISGAVSLLAIRYLQDNDLINGVLLPYGVLGIALTAILPFIIYFFFVEKSIKHTSGRRLAWAFYLVIFGVLWNARVTELSPIGNQIYLWTFVAGVVALIFDKGIQWYFGHNEDLKHRIDTFNRQIADIDTKLAGYYANDNPTEEVKDTIKALEKKRKELKKNRSTGFF